VDFLKQTPKFLLPKNLILQVKFSINPQTACQKEEFENWLDFDYNAEVVVTITVSEICEAVADDKSKLAEQSESNCTNKEEEILVASPTNAKMRETLRILRRGLQHRATDFQKHYEYEQFIPELLNANTNTSQHYISFLKINFVAFIHVKRCNNKLS
jgi:hypothetical protein